ncbi:MAG TPA: prepilin-type N-terminal cleavage/methylation domain-containing protein, partial [Candidatus Eisenbacteria bacterium]
MTLVELAVAVLVPGPPLGIGLPALLQYRRNHELVFVEKSALILVRQRGLQSVPLRGSERGFTLLEALVALTILAVGILAVACLFPSVSGNQMRAQMLTAASYYAREKVEELSALSWSDAALSEGRHPEGTVTEDIGSNNAWHRYYVVTTLTGALED